MLKLSLELSDVQIVTLKKRVDNVAASIQKYEKELKEQNSFINQLKREERIWDLGQSQDALEQYTRKVNVEIHRIPEQRDGDLHQVVTNLARKLNLNVCKQDIDLVHRLKRNFAASKPIIIHFVSLTEKQEFYQAWFKIREADVANLFPTSHG